MITLIHQIPHVDRKALQRVVRTAEHTIGCTQSALQDIYNTRCCRKAKKIIRDLSHGLFSKLPSTQMRTVLEHHGEN